MYFNCRLSVTINNKLLTSVVGLRTSNDASKVGSSCEIVVPLNSYIEYSDPNTLNTYLLAVRVDTFPQGAPVEIIASYEGFPPLTIFSGFIFDFVLGMPATIRCLDYSYFFNLGVFGDRRIVLRNKNSKTNEIKNQGQGVNYKSITLKDLLQQLIDFVNKTVEQTQETTGAQPVSLMLPTVDMTLQNLTFISMSPAAILEWLKKELGLNMTFYGNQLYVNLASKTNGTITLNTEYNVLRSGLQTTFQGSILNNGSPTSLTYQSAFQKIRMKCWFLREDGTRDSFEVGDENGIQQEHYFYKVKRDNQIYETLATNALLKAQQHQYRGEMELLLYPDCDLFYEVNYTDKRYPEKNGVYVILSVSYELGPNGFHRKIKVAWLSSITYTNSAGQVVSS